MRPNRPVDRTRRFMASSWQRPCGEPVTLIVRRAPFLGHTTSTCTDFGSCSSSPSAPPKSRSPVGATRVLRLRAWPLIDTDFARMLIIPTPAPPILLVTQMVKILFCLRRLPTLSVQEFQNYWYEVHAPLVKKHQQVLRIARYVQFHSDLGEITWKPTAFRERRRGQTTQR
jgi:EthD domain